MSAAPVDRRQEEAFAAYVEAHDRAKRTLALADGIEAGRAWRRFLDLFLTDAQRGAPGSNVFPMRSSR